ncbi:unnamed protein product [Schistocephalus solidus]|uniref:Uncharacterized protein n=1 Tax=Schistocephalus solidus TaxID=70667 RepID=A0A3P7C423_SCHSO|nr:unnamed protein product [Schistocephalus solidus]
MTPGLGGGGGESAVDAVQVYYHLKLIHAQVTVPAPSGVEHTVDFVEIDGRTTVCVWLHAQGRLRPRQPPAPSPISGLLDSVLTPGSGGGGGESAVDAVQVVNSPVATSSCFPTLTCGSSKLVLLSGHTPGNRHDLWATPGEGLRPLLSPLLFSSSPSSLPSFFLSLLLSFTLTSTPPILPLSSTFPPPPRSKTSYGEGDMKSRRRPRQKDPSLTYPNRDHSGVR